MYPWTIFFPRIDIYVGILSKRTYPPMGICLHICIYMVFLFSYSHSWPQTRPSCETCWWDWVLVTSGSSLVRRCARLECQRPRVKCSHQRRLISMYPAILRLIITLPFHPELLLSLVSSCFKNVFHLVSCHTSLSHEWCRAFVGCTKTRIASFEKTKSAIIDLMCALPKVYGKSKETCTPFISVTSNGANQWAVSLYGRSRGMCFESSHTMSPTAIVDGVKWRLLLLLLVKKYCSSFVWNSQGAVFYAHRSERLWFADCHHILYFSKKKRHVKRKKQLAQIIKTCSTAYI